MQPTAPATGGKRIAQRLLNVEYITSITQATVSFTESKMQGMI
jgi:hypothetical protein